MVTFIEWLPHARPCARHWQPENIDLVLEYDRG